MEVKLDTVRRWLRIAAKHSEQVNAVLLKGLKVSQVELDALWSFVKKNDLRRRANLWREKSGTESSLAEPLVADTEARLCHEALPLIK